MVREAKVERSYQFAHGPNEARLSVKKTSPALMLLLIIPASLALAVAFITFTFMATFGLDGTRSAKEVSVMMLITTVAAAIGAGLFWLANNMKTTATVTINHDGIVLRNTLYRYRNIASYGIDNAHSGRSYNLGTTGGQMGRLAGHYGYFIYIIYGTKKIPIVSGLDDDGARQLYDELIEVLNQYGASVHASVMAAS